MDTWESVADHYRRRWEEHYGAAAAAAHWEHYEPRYRFAWEMGRDPEVGGKSWIMAQPELRRRWEEQHTDAGATVDGWDQVSDTVRHAWEHPAEMGASERAGSG